MKVELSAAQLRLMRFAIETAIASEEDFIDCHRMRGGDKIPECHAEVVAKTRSTIKALQRLGRKLSREKINE